MRRSFVGLNTVHSLFSLSDDVKSFLRPTTSIICKLFNVQNSWGCHLITSVDVISLHRPFVTVSENPAGNPACYMGATQQGEVSGRRSADPKLHNDPPDFWRVVLCNTTSSEAC